MLIPAILKQDEITIEMQKKFYTDDMFYETGCIIDNWIPNFKSDNGQYNYAIVDSNNKLLGFLSYYIDWYSSSVSRFGLISFCKGNFTLGRDLYNEMNKFINEYKLHRIEWRMVGGNPVERSYDRFCKKFNGTKHVLRDVIKDRYGNYHDDIIYEIILDN